MVALNPLEKRSVNPLTVPHAFRSWSHWTNKLGIGCLQVPYVFAQFEGATSDSDLAQLLDALCEVYSRAIFEVCIALQYDRVDTLADVHVLQLVHDRWGIGMADAVHQTVRAHGPVARELQAILETPRPDELTIPGPDLMAPLLAEAGLS